MRLRSKLIAFGAVVAVLSIISMAAGNGSRPHRAQHAAPDAPAEAHARTSGPLVHRVEQTHHGQAKLKPVTGVTGPAQAASAPLPRMVGQQLMVRMSGTTPDAALLARIHSGEVGGVILYDENIVFSSQVASLVAELQSAARAGGNPPLLISTDQEGGLVKRIPWAPPALSPPQLAAQGALESRGQGRATGKAMRALGITVDLAPVVDVAHSRSAFIWQQQRSFGTNASTVRDSTTAFATGMEEAGVAPTAKHFPGLGSALTDTDYALQRIHLSRDDLIPYDALISEHIPLIMVSTAIYTNLDPNNPAALSTEVISSLLRQGLKYQGVIITDDLERPTGGSTADAVVRADRAGADIILVSSSESGGQVAYAALLRAAQDGQISHAAISDAYQRILLLKQRYAARKHDQPSGVGASVRHEQH